MILMIRARARAFKFFSKKKKQPTARARNRIETPSSERTQPNDRVDADDEPSRTRASSSSSIASSIATRADRNDRRIFSTVHPIALNRRVPSVGTNAHDGTNGTRPTTPSPARSPSRSPTRPSVRPSRASVVRPSVRPSRASGNRTVVRSLVQNPRRPSSVVVVPSVVRRPGHATNAQPRVGAIESPARVPSVVVVRRPSRRRRRRRRQNTHRVVLNPLKRPCARECGRRRPARGGRIDEFPRSPQRVAWSTASERVVATFWSVCNGSSVVSFRGSRLVDRDVTRSPQRVRDRARPRWVG